MIWRDPLWIYKLLHGLIFFTIESFFHCMGVGSFCYLIQCFFFFFLSSLFKKLFFFCCLKKVSSLYCRRALLLFIFENDPFSLFVEKALRTFHFYKLKMSLFFFVWGIPFIYHLKVLSIIFSTMGVKC